MLPLIRIHPFDLYDKLKQLPAAELRALAACSCEMEPRAVINGVEYIEDRSIAFDIETAKRNGLVEG